MMKCFFSSVISFLKDYRFFRFSSPLGIFIITPSLVSSVLGRDFVELSNFPFFLRALLTRFCIMFNRPMFLMEN